MQLDFSTIKKAVEARYAEIAKHRLYRSEATKDEIWDTYLESFPEGSNPMFRERTEHDCSCCKNFVRNIGSIVAIVDGKIETIWDVELDGPYGEVCKALAELVRSKGIQCVLLSTERGYGADYTLEQTSPSVEPRRWEHFHGLIPSNHQARGEDIGGRTSHYRSSYDVFHRALQEITLEALTTVKELIAQKSLYRGDEFLNLVDKFARHKNVAMGVTRDDLILYCWKAVLAETDAVLRIRNSAIGTLLVDLSDGVGIEEAVGKFEAKVAPENYKRPTALITSGMIEKAHAQVKELGFEPSLYRRFAATEDITINNVLFADRESTVKMTGNPFDDLQAEKPENPKAYDKVQEVPIDDFLENMLPLVKKVEVLIENRHTGNLMSLIAPEFLDAPGMFKWHNNFSWAYKGEVADSMKERVKQAGGDVTGDLRFSIQWNDEETYNGSDYDAHCKMPNGSTIYFSRKQHPAVGGKLDVDIISPQKGKPAVENITFANRSKMPKGDYQMMVHNYSSGGSGDTGFRAEIEFDGMLFNFDYQRKLKNGEKVQVATVHWDGANFGISPILPTAVSSKNVWGVRTQQFAPVEMIMLSPNHWDEKVQGNKHVFFMLKDCLNPDDARGFFNEFLVESLNEHRKVFEVLGSKMRATHTDNQLSGLGFSSTQRNSVVVRLTGAMARVVKVVF
jgi:hypothetical protein